MRRRDEWDRLATALLANIERQSESGYEVIVESVADQLRAHVGAEKPPELSGDDYHRRADIPCRNCERPLKYHVTGDRYGRILCPAGRGKHYMEKLS